MNVQKKTRPSHTEHRGFHFSKSFKIIILLLLTPLAMICIVSFIHNRAAASDKVRLSNLYSKVGLPSNMKLNSSHWEPGSLDVSQEWTYIYSSPEDQKSAYQELATAFQKAGYRVIPPEKLNGDPICKVTEFGTFNAVNKASNIQAFADLSSQSAQAVAGGDCTTLPLAPQKIEMQVRDDEWDQSTQTN